MQTILINTVVHIMGFFGRRCKNVAWTLQARRYIWLRRHIARKQHILAINTSKRMNFLYLGMKITDIHLRKRYGITNASKERGDAREKPSLVARCSWWLMDLLQMIWANSNWKKTLANVISRRQLFSPKLGAKITILKYLRIFESLDLVHAMQHLCGLCC